MEIESEEEMMTTWRCWCIGPRDHLSCRDSPDLSSTNSSAAASEGLFSFFWTILALPWHGWHPAEALKLGERGDWIGHLDGVSLLQAAVHSSTTDQMTIAFYQPKLGWHVAGHEGVHRQHGGAVVAISVWGVWGLRRPGLSWWLVY